MPYKLNLFRLSMVSGDWEFIGKYTPEEISAIEAKELEAVYLTNGW